MQHCMAGMLAQVWRPRAQGLTIAAPRQITDIHLLGLAVSHGGRLATFHEGIPRSAVMGAEARHPVVI
jgi:hypothetical protein